MAHRKFDSPSTAPAEPTTFEISGKRMSTGETWTETFTCTPIPPSGILIDLAGSFGTDEKGNRILNPGAISGFLRGVLTDEDAERFDALTHDKDRVVELDLLGEIVIWLSEEVVGRPISR